MSVKQPSNQSLASDTLLNQRFNWLCKQRENRSNNNEVWDLGRCRYLKNTDGIHKALKQVSQLLTRLKLKMHPDKTFLGCIKKGFDFLGIHFGETPNISNTSIENHRAKLARRYAQGASPACIGNYLARWTSCCAGVLKCCSNPFVVIHSIGQADNRHLSLMDLLIDGPT